MIEHLTHRVMGRLSHHRADRSLHEARFQKSLFAGPPPKCSIECRAGCSCSILQFGPRLWLSFGLSVGSCANVVKRLGSNKLLVPAVEA
jgi:hypothetical protein